MAERRISDLDDSYQKISTRKPRKRFRKRYMVLGALVLLLGAALFGVPAAVQNRGIFLSAANRFGGIDPLKIDVASIQAGWFSPVKLAGLRLLDDKGTEVAKIGQVETELGLWQLATNYSDLKVITLRDIAVSVDVQPGTTSIEEALKPLLSKPSSGSAELAGRLKIINAVIRAKDSVDLAAWDLTISEADIPLPTKSQPIPAVSCSGGIQSASVNGLGGGFSLKVEPLAAADPASMQPLRFTLATNGLPLHVWSLAKRRFPELPIDQLAGVASMNATATLVSPTEWEAQIVDGSLSQLQVIAPQFVGNQPAQIQQIKLSGGATMNNNRLTARDASVVCDFGNMRGDAIIPMPIVIPTAAKPWLENAELNIVGQVDLPKLMQVAPGMIALQEQAQIVSGSAKLAAIQKSNGSSTPTAEFRLDLDELIGTVAGTPIRWDQPLSAKVNIQPDASGAPQFAANCKAEFCNLDASGEIKQGQLAAQLDLDKLQQRLSQFEALPVEQMSGTAKLDLAWKQEIANRIQATGTLVTSPVKVKLPTGSLNEPAWNGRFDVSARLDGTTFSQIDRAKFNLNATNESLVVDLQEPISLVPPAAGAEPFPPAQTTIHLEGDLAGWLKRAEMASGYDMGIKLAGRGNLDAVGATSSTKAVITQAKFEADNFQYEGQGYVYNEPRIVGQFKGLASSDDFMKVQIENLTVQAETFALTAVDAPSADGNSRQGQAAYRVDMRRVMQILMASSASTSEPTMQVQGDVTGRAAWTIDSTAISWQIQADAGKLDFIQSAAAPRATLTSTANPSPTSILWSEPWAKAFIVGRYDLTTGAINMPDTQLETDWIKYAGLASMETVDAKSKMKAQGQLAYDAAVVAQKLRPWTGNYVNVVGKRVEPVEFVWTSSDDANWAKSLQASAQIGWDTANVIGIDVGQADVPLTIENGVFKSATTIPVSQGALRWDLTGDVGANPLVIREAPAKVIDNVAITPMMCQGWMKYVAPLLADVTKVEGKVSLQIDNALIVPASTRQQSIAGQLQVHGATVGPGPLADQILLLVQQIRALRKGNLAGATQNQVTWLQMPEQNIDFAVEQGRVIHKNMQITAGDIVIATSGAVDLDGSIDMMATVPIRQEWVDGTPALASLAGQQLNLPIRGTLQRPQADMRIFTQLATQVAQSVVQGEVKKQLDKGLNKLLGPVQQQLNQLPSIPVPNFQVPNFPGFLPQQPGPPK